MKVKVKQIQDAGAALTDDSVDTFYACLICQSQAPGHVCIITPKRMGICGNYSWQDSKTTYESDPYGPKKPITKGVLTDARLGQWRGVNDFIYKASNNKIVHGSLYSMMHDPLTASGLAEAITAVLPECNGVMTVSREYRGQTPCGMTYTELLGIMGGGTQTPGFIGHSKDGITRRNFIKAEGGISRIVWMNKKLKEEIREKFVVRAKEISAARLLDKVADETVGVTEESILPFLKDKKHPALTMKSILE